MENKAESQGDENDNEVGYGGRRKFHVAGAGIVSGLFSAFFVSPLDVLKARVQNSPRTLSEYNKVVEGLKTLWKKEGLRGCYSGFNLTLYVYSMDRAIWFSIYEISSFYLTKNAVHNKRDPTTATRIFVDFFASILGSIVSIVSMNPLWVARTRAMVIDDKYPKNIRESYRNPVSSILHIVRTGGFLDLYSGLTLSMIGISHVAIQFPLYQELKRYMISKDMKENPSILLSILISKIVASGITYPHETIRTRLYTGRMNIDNTNDAIKRQSIANIFRSVIQDGGLRGFYKGFSFNFLRTLISGTINLWTYEKLLKFSF